MGQHIHRPRGAEWRDREACFPGAGEGRSPADAVSTELLRRERMEAAKAGRGWLDVGRMRTMGMGWQ